VAYQEGNGIGYGAVLSTPTVGVVKRRNSGFAVAGIDKPLFDADPPACFGDAQEGVARSPMNSKPSERPHPHPRPAIHCDAEPTPRRT
jgi:hypothetical protein